jgi:biotin carboxyl carrier protein
VYWLVKKVANTYGKKPIPKGKLVTLCNKTPSFAADFEGNTFRPRMIRAATHCGLTGTEIISLMAAWLKYHGQQYTVEQWREWKRDVLIPAQDAAKPHIAKRKAQHAAHMRQKRAEHRQENPDKRRTETATKILAALPGTVDEIIAKTGLAQTTVDSALRRLVKAGDAVRRWRGYYARFV